MTIIGGNFRFSGNPTQDLKMYAKKNKISKEKAKEELKNTYGDATQNGKQKITKENINSYNNFMAIQSAYNLATQKINIKNNNPIDAGNTKKITADTISDDKMSRIITYADGSTTEFYYNQEKQTLETYEKKPIDQNGNMEIIDYKNSQNVDKNPIENEKALKQLNDRPNFSVKSAKSFIDTSGVEFNKVEEFKNVANIQIDYDANGNKSCLILLDNDGNRIGHMWLKEQNEYTTDNKVGELVLYNSKNRYQFNSVGKLNS